MFALASGSYRFRPLKEGLAGWDVFALQKALGAVADGKFGPATKRALTAFQRKHRLEDDGIGGPVTQRELGKQLIWPIQASMGTPSGLARGLVEGESGFILGQHTAVYPNGTRDVGLMQMNVVPSAQHLSEAFDGSYAIARSLAKLSERADEFLPMRGVAQSQRQAWRLAVLAHNWPAAAFQFANGSISSWRYKSRGIFYRMDQPAPWIIEQGVHGVSTGFQWCEHYLDSKLIYASALR